MEDTFNLFEKCKMNDKAMRRALFVKSLETFREENVLFMICCHDYVYHPEDYKISALVNLFIKSGSLIEINVSSSQRNKALKLLSDPKIQVNFEHIASNKSPRNRPKLQMSKQGGAREGGAANYNLMTKAIEITLPVCMKQVPKELINSVVTGGNVYSNTPIHSRGMTKVQALTQYYGAGIFELGIT